MITRAKIFFPQLLLIRASVASAIYRRVSPSRAALDAPVSERLRRKDALKEGTLRGWRRWLELPRAHHSLTSVWHLYGA